MRAVVGGKDALKICVKVRQRRTVFAYMNSPVCGRTFVLMLIVVSTLVRFFEASPRRSSASCREESSSLSPCPLMGGMRIVC